MNHKTYSAVKISKLNLIALNDVCKTLYLSGKDMVTRYGLTHWNNSYFKECIIVFLCNLKNDIYLVKNGNDIVATFQIKKNGDNLFFSKLATNPLFLGQGVGSFCMKEIELMAKKQKCKNVICEVYDKSIHAKNFYEKRGYTIYGLIDTLKYKELKMKKEMDI